MSTTTADRNHNRVYRRFSRLLRKKRARERRQKRTQWVLQKLGSQGVDTSVLPLNCWLYQVFCRRSNIADQLVVSVLTAFLRKLQKVADEPDGWTSNPHRSLRSTFRLMMRLLDQHPDQRTVREVLQLLDSQPTACWHDQLFNINAAARARVRQRTEAAVPAQAVSDSLPEFLAFVARTFGGESAQFPAVGFDAPQSSGRYKSLAEAAARNQVRAFNTSTRIQLQSIVAATPHAYLNELFFYYLGTHEVLHTVVGSFDFSFRPPRGRLIKRMLRRYRRSGHRDRAARQRRRKQIEQVFEKEGLMREYEKVRSTPLVQFFEAFGSRGKVLRLIFNGLEDGRLETAIRKRVPGMNEVFTRVLDTYSFEVCQSEHVMGDESRLINGVAMYAADRPWEHFVPRTFSKEFAMAKSIIDATRQQPQQSVYDSLLAVIRLHDLLFRAVDPSDRSGNQMGPSEPGEDLFWADEYGLEDNIDAGQPTGVGYRLDEERDPVERIAKELQLSDTDEDLDIGALRRVLVERSGGSWGDSDDNDPMETDPEYTPEHQGVWLPELSRGELVLRATHLTLHPYKNKATPLSSLLPRLQVPFPSITGTSVKRRIGSYRQWSEDGVEIAEERYAEYYASIRAGFQPQIQFDRRQRISNLHVTLILDASIAVAARRLALSGDSSLLRMIQLGEWISRGLESQGVSLEAFAGVSGGLHLVQLQEMCRPIQHSIQQFRAIGAGGFRLGSMLRGVTQKREQLGLPPVQGEHRIVVLTDGDTKYLNVAKESVFQSLWRRNCPGCTTRAACRITHARGAMDQRVDSCFLNGSPTHALADIQHELTRQRQQTSGPHSTTTMIVAFSDTMNIDQWDHFLASNWISAINNESAAERVGRFLVG